MKKKYYHLIYLIQTFINRIKEYKKIIFGVYYEDDTFPTISRYIQLLTDEELNKYREKLERKQKKKKERLYKREELQKKILKTLRIVDDTYETKRERKEREKREKLEKYFNISNKTNIKEKK